LGLLTSKRRQASNHETFGLATLGLIRQPPISYPRPSIFSGKRKWRPKRAGSTSSTDNRKSASAALWPWPGQGRMGPGPARAEGLCRCSRNPSARPTEPTVRNSIKEVNRQYFLPVGAGKAAGYICLHRPDRSRSHSNKLCQQAHNNLFLSRNFYLVLPALKFTR